MIGSMVAVLASMTKRLFLCICILGLIASSASAQVSVTIAGYSVNAGRQEKLGDKHWMLTGGVVLERSDTSLYADELEYFEDEEKAIARGNVLFTQGTNRISADRAEFQTHTALGTFYNATGITTMKPPRQTPQPGGLFIPQQTNVDSDVIFFGETIEKLSPKKYKIKNGGFSTCVQPTPRWELSADTIVLNVDDYTFLTQAIFKVKNVPLFYVPAMYFPTNEDGRATGFLLPTYGWDRIKGQSLFVPFFWAINRSQDATIEGQWYSKFGRGATGEYRYNYGAGSNGFLTGDMLDRQIPLYAGGTPNERTFKLRGVANQELPARLRARANIDYFSSISTQVLDNTYLGGASSTSAYGANVVGAWRSYSLNATYDRRQYFASQTSSRVSGTSPRISLSRSERPITQRSPLYFAVNTELVHLDNETRNDATVDDTSLGRVDFLPTIRYPFKKWQWFTVNSSASWRNTYYSRSLQRNATTGQQMIVDEGLNRQYFTVTSTATGPTFTRVWNTPKSGYAERLKHTIEPAFTAQRTSAIARFDDIVKTDSVDTFFGNTTSFTYGLSNRLYAKRKLTPTGAAVSQEIASLSIQQSYYTDGRAAQFDRQYASSQYTTQATNHFAPVMVDLRVTPTQSYNTTMRLEIDSRTKALRSLSVAGNHDWNRRLQTSVNWSKNFLINDATGEKTPIGHSLTMSTRATTLDNRYGFDYALSLDVLRSTLTQQRMTGFYNSQCCGLAMSYLVNNVPGVQSYLYPTNRTFLLSFTLAGLGNFSPISRGTGGR
jgi:LPS-assembly protein